jgi:DNA repair protein RadC
VNFIFKFNKKKEKMKQNLTIKSWAEDDRPREKMILKGRHTLSDAELLAILLGSGSRNQSAVELAQEMLLSVSNSLNDFGKKSLKELQKFKGVGEAKAITVLAAIELGRRRNEVEVVKKIKVRNAQVVFDFMSSTFKDLGHEEFHVVLLNRANEIIHKEQISKGGISGTIVDGKVIFKTAIDHSASALILCHNHPSGQLFPSLQDEKITSELISFGKMIDLPVLDHLIFTDNGYFSFADNGLMK